MIGRMQLFILLMFGLSCQAQTNNTGSVKVFLGETPCVLASPSLPNIPANAPCDFIKCRLTLTGSEKNPQGFTLKYTWGLVNEGTPNHINGGTTSTIKGNWSITNGSKFSASAIVYVLQPEGSTIPIYFVKLSDSLLHQLDSEKRLMIGNPGWSYTFNLEAKQP